MVSKREQTNNKQFFEVSIDHQDIIDLMNSRLDIPDVDYLQDVQIFVQDTEGKEFLLHDFIPKDKVVFRFYRSTDTDTTTTYDTTCLEFKQVAGK